MANSFVLEKLWPSVLIGVIVMAFWLQRYVSSNKTWYFQTSNSAILVGVARFWYYVTPFLALAFLMFGINAATGSDPHSMIPVYWVRVGAGSVVIGLIIGFLQPNWLSPPWLRRLRREYGDDVIDLLIEDAIGMDKYDLEQRLETKEAMEQWIAEVQSKDDV